MAKLRSNNIEFHFPEIDEDYTAYISFCKTLRIPDNGEDYPLPPFLGEFHLRHVEDYRATLPAEIVERGGLLMPMWQSEAMWIQFSTGRSRRWEELPAAVKIGAGKINCVTGQPWSHELHREPQDYIVLPQQPWIDGFAVQPGLVRQFVAMPLGSGKTVEEKLSGSTEWGGIQLSVTPLKKERLRPKEKRYISLLQRDSISAPRHGLAAGGKIKQKIYEDEHAPTDWDLEKTERVWITIINAEAWEEITGETCPSTPLSAHDYLGTAFPWFEYYDPDGKIANLTYIFPDLSSIDEDDVDDDDIDPRWTSMPEANFKPPEARIIKGGKREAF